MANGETRSRSRNERSALCNRNGSFMLVRRSGTIGFVWRNRGKNGGMAVDDKENFLLPALAQAGDGAGCLTFVGWAWRK